MPVEIKELVIRTVVGASAAAPGEDPAHAASGAALASRDAAAAEEIVQECVRQVLHILAKNKER